MSDAAWMSLLYQSAAGARSYLAVRDLNLKIT